MKKIIPVFCLLFLSVNFSAQQQKTSRDSIKIFYQKMFKSLEVAYLYKNNYDWKKLKAETFQNLERYLDFKSSLEEVKVLLGKINADHSKIIYQGKSYGSLVDFDKERLSEAWKKKYAAKPEFELRVLNGKYGYILMPSISLSDYSKENIQKVAQPLYDQIAEVKSKNKLEGWILDLRFNTGGNDAPMILALYDLLGDHVVWKTLDGNKKVSSLVKLNKGTYEAGSKNTSIKPSGLVTDESKVAVITGLLTASSGEVTALAFKGRPNTLFIGEKTLGKTTSNMVVELPFGAVMPLSIGYDADRNGIYYKQIIPDIAVSKQDNFDDLLQDKNIQEAIYFFQKNS